MLVLKSINEFLEYRESLSKETKIGFVPTMGFLHEGHLSLVRASKDSNDVTIVSIFVNPKQFGENEDFRFYPRDIDKDLGFLKGLNVEAVFIPEADDIYPANFKTYVEVSEYGTKYCGKSRPTHFKGVSTIVCKLLNIVRPQLMYLGEKDFQQAYILEQMVRDLTILTKIVKVETSREIDGLAMSSRNVYLNDEQRKDALCLYEALVLAKDYFAKGDTDIKDIEVNMKSVIKTKGGLIDYITFINENTFEEEEKLTVDTRILIAVKIGNTRLIDNMRVC